MQFYEQALSQYNSANKNPKKKSYIEIVLTLVLLIVLVLMIYPAITHILTLNKEITAGKTVEAGLAKKIDDLVVAEQNFDDVQDQLPLLELALPTNSDLDKYLQAPIESLAAKTGVELKAVQFNDLPLLKSPGENLSLRQMPFTVSLTSDFSKFTGFLTELEKFVRVTNVETIQIKGSGSALDINIQASTNFLGTPITVPNQAAGGTN